MADATGHIRVETIIDDSLKSGLKGVSDSIFLVSARINGLNLLTRSLTNSNYAVSQSLRSVSSAQSGVAKSARELAANQAIVANYLKQVRTEASAASSALHSHQMTLSQTSAGYKQAGAEIDFINQKLRHLNSTQKVVDRTMRANALQTMSKQYNKQATELSYVGQRLTMGLTLPLVTLGRLGFSSLKKLDQELIRTRKLLDDTQDGAAGVEATMKVLGDRLDEISYKWGVSRELLQGLAGDFAELGISDATTLGNLVQITNEIEKLGNVDITDAGKLTQSVYQNLLRIRRLQGVNVGEPEVMKQVTQEVRGAIALFNYAENKTSLSLKNIADAFPEVSGAATSFGLSMATTAALLVPMVSAGFQVGASANSIKVSLQKLVLPTKDTRKLISALRQELGPNFKMSADVGEKGLQNLIDGYIELEKSAYKTQGTMQLFGKAFGVRQGPRMEVAIQQMAAFQKELNKGALTAANPKGSNEALLLSQLEQSINAKFKNDRLLKDQKITLRSVQDIQKLNELATEKVKNEKTGNYVLTERATIIQGIQAQEAKQLRTNKELSTAMGKITTESGKILIGSAYGKEETARTMEEELRKSEQSLNVQAGRVRESVKSIARDFTVAFGEILKTVSPIFIKIAKTIRELSPGFKKAIGLAAIFLVTIGPIIRIFSLFKQSQSLAMLGLSKGLTLGRTQAQQLDAQLLKTSDSLLRLGKIGKVTQIGDKIFLEGKAKTNKKAMELVGLESQYDPTDTSRSSRRTGKKISSLKKDLGIVNKGRTNDMDVSGLMPGTLDALGLNPFTKNAAGATSKLSPQMQAQRQSGIDAAKARAAALKAAAGNAGLISVGTAPSAVTQSVNSSVQNSLNQIVAILQAIENCACNGKNALTSKPQGIPGSGGISPTGPPAFLPPAIPAGGTGMPPPQPGTAVSPSGGQPATTTVTLPGGRVLTSTPTPTPTPAPTPTPTPAPTPTQTTNDRLPHGLQVSTQLEGFTRLEDDVKNVGVKVQNVFTAAVEHVKKSQQNLNAAVNAQVENVAEVIDKTVQTVQESTEPVRRRGRPRNTQGQAPTGPVFPTGLNPYVAPTAPTGPVFPTGLNPYVAPPEVTKPSLAERTQAQLERSARRAADVKLSSPYDNEGLVTSGVASRPRKPRIGGGFVPMNFGLVAGLFKAREQRMPMSKLERLASSLGPFSTKFKPSKPEVPFSNPLGFLRNAVRQSRARFVPREEQRVLQEDGTEQVIPAFTQATRRERLRKVLLPMTALQKPKVTTPETAKEAAARVKQISANLLMESRSVSATGVSPEQEESIRLRNERVNRAVELARSSPRYQGPGGQAALKAKVARLEEYRDKKFTSLREPAPVMKPEDAEKLNQIKQYQRDKQEVPEKLQKEVDTAIQKNAQDFAKRQERLDLAKQRAATSGRAGTGRLIPAITLAATQRTLKTKIQAVKARAVSSFNKLDGGVRYGEDGSVSYSNLMRNIDDGSPEDDQPVRPRSQRRLRLSEFVANPQGALSRVVRPIYRGKQVKKNLKGEYNASQAKLADELTRRKNQSRRFMMQLSTNRTVAKYGEDDPSLPARLRSIRQKFGSFGDSTRFFGGKAFEEAQQAIGQENDRRAADARARRAEYDATKGEAVLQDDGREKGKKIVTPDGKEKIISKPREAQPKPVFQSQNEARAYARSIGRKYTSVAYPTLSTPEGGETENLLRSRKTALVKGTPEEEKAKKEKRKANRISVPLSTSARAAGEVGARSRQEMFDAAKLYKEQEAARKGEEAAEFNRASSIQARVKPRTLAGRISRQLGRSMRRKPKEFIPSPFSTPEEGQPPIERYSREEAAAIDRNRQEKETARRRGMSQAQIDLEAKNFKPLITPVPKPTAGGGATGEASFAAPRAADPFGGADPFGMDRTLSSARKQARIPGIAFVDKSMGAITGSITSSVESVYESIRKALNIPVDVMDKVEAELAEKHTQITTVGRKAATEVGASLDGLTAGIKVALGGAEMTVENVKAAFVAKRGMFGKIINKEKASTASATGAAPATETTASAAGSGALIGGGLDRDARKILVKQVADEIRDTKVAVDNFMSYEKKTLEYLAQEFQIKGASGMAKEVLAEKIRTAIKGLEYALVAEVQGVTTTLSTAQSAVATTPSTVPTVADDVVVGVKQLDQAVKNNIQKIIAVQASAYLGVQQAQQGLSNLGTSVKRPTPTSAPTAPTPTIPNIKPNLSMGSFGVPVDFNTLKNIMYPAPTVPTVPTVPAAPKSYAQFYANRGIEEPVKRSRIKEAMASGKERVGALVSKAKSIPMGRGTEPLFPAQLASPVKSWTAAYAKWGAEKLKNPAPVPKSWKTAYEKWGAEKLKNPAPVPKSWATAYEKWGIQGLKKTPVLQTAMQGAKRVAKVAGKVAKVAGKEALSATVFGPFYGVSKVSKALKAINQEIDAGSNRFTQKISKFKKGITYLGYVVADELGKVAGKPIADKFRSANAKMGGTTRFKTARNAIGMGAAGIAGMAAMPLLAPSAVVAGAIAGPIAAGKGAIKLGKKVMSSDKTQNFLQNTRTGQDIQKGLDLVASTINKGGALILQAGQSIQNKVMPVWESTKQVGIAIGKAVTHPVVALQDAGKKVGNALIGLSQNVVKGTKDFTVRTAKSVKERLVGGTTTYDTQLGTIKKSGGIFKADQTLDQATGVVTKGRGFFGKGIAGAASGVKKGVTGAARGVKSGIGTGGGMAQSALSMVIPPQLMFLQTLFPQLIKFAQKFTKTFSVIAIVVLVAVGAFKFLKSTFSKWGEYAEDFMENFKAAWRVLVGIFAVVKNAISDFFKSFFNGGGKSSDSMMNIGKTVLKVSKIVKEFAYKFNAFFNEKIKPALYAFLSGLKLVILGAIKLFGGIFNVIKGIVQKFQGKGDEAGKSFDKGFDMIKNGALKIFKGIIKALGVFLVIFIRAIEVVAVFIVNVFEKVLILVVKIIALLVRGIVNLFFMIPKGIVVIVQQMLNIWKELETAYIKIVAELVKIVVSILFDIPKFVVDLVRKMIDFFAYLITGWGKILDKMSELFVKWMQSLLDFAANQDGFFGIFFDYTGITKVTQAMKAIVGVVGGAVSAIGSVYETAGDLVKGISDSVLGGISNGLASWKEKTKNGIDVIAGVLITGVEAVADFGQTLYNIVDAANNGTLSLIDTAVGGTTKFISRASDVVGLIADFVVDKIKKISFGDDIKQSLAPKVEKKVKEALENLDPEAAAAAGKDIATAIEEGLSTLRTNFFDKVVDNLGKALEKQKNKITEALNLQKDNQLKIYDDQIAAIDALAAAEEKLTATIEFENQKREAEEERALKKRNYEKQRALAIYEGRIDDARTLDQEETKSRKDAEKAAKDLDTSRNKTLQSENRDTAKGVITAQKTKAAEAFDADIKAFEEFAAEILAQGTFTEAELASQFAAISGKATEMSGTMRTSFEAFYLAIPALIQSNVGNTAGMFDTEMGKLVTAAKDNFGTVNDLTNPETVLGATAAMLTGSTTVFATLMPAVVAQYGTGIADLNQISSGFNPSTLFEKAISDATETLKREYIKMKTGAGSAFRDIVTRINEELNGLMIDQAIQSVVDRLPGAMDNALGSGASAGIPAINAGNAQEYVDFARQFANGPTLASAYTPPASSAPTGSPAQRLSKAAFRNQMGRDGFFGQGERGEFVSNIKKALNHYGYNAGSGDTLGTAASAEVAKFQQTYGVRPVNGRVNLDTAEKLGLFNEPGVPKRYYGGPIPGASMVPGATSQAVPAVLHGGEYVINAKAATNLGSGFLDYLNSLKYGLEGSLMPGDEARTVLHGEARIPLKKFVKTPDYTSLESGFGYRLLQMFRENPSIGLQLGGGGRTASYAGGEFYKRYQVFTGIVDEEDPDTYADIRAAKLKFNPEDGQYYKLKPNKYAVAVPNQSYHILGKAADLLGDLALAGRVTKEYGLVQVLGTGEEHHFQPTGVPKGKRGLDYLRNEYGLDAIKTPINSSIMGFLDNFLASNAKKQPVAIRRALDRLVKDFFFQMGDEERASQIKVVPEIPYQLAEKRLIPEIPYGLVTQDPIPEIPYSLVTQGPKVDTPSLVTQGPKVDTPKTALKAKTIVSKIMKPIISTIDKPAIAKIVEAVTNKQSEVSIKPEQIEVIKKAIVPSRVAALSSEPKIDAKKGYSAQNLSEDAFKKQAGKNGFIEPNTKASYVSDIKKALRFYGYDVNTSDTLGAAATAAVAQFQSEYGLGGNGKLNLATARSLGLFGQDGVVKKYYGGPIKRMMGGPVGAYGAGGNVPGFAMQAVPALLHGGEYVINSKAVQNLGSGFLQYLNNMKYGMPKFSVPNPSMPNVNINQTVNVNGGNSENISNYNFYVDNFIGEDKWFEGMMNEYNVKVVPNKQKSAGLESRVIRSYNGINKGI